jgi:hypothetical protein
VKKMLLQRNLVFIPVLAMLFFCFMAVPSYAAKKSSKSAPPKVKSAGLSYATTPFDETWESLPKNYRGHDIRAVHKALSKNLNLQKDQFETEEQFKQRKQQAWEKTILGNMTADDQFAFVLEDPEKEYDAEHARFIFKIRNFDNGGVGIQSKRTGENRLGQDIAKRTVQDGKRKRRMRGQETMSTDLAGALFESAVQAAGTGEIFSVNFSAEDWEKLNNITVDMQPEEARKNKDNMNLLLVGSISGNSPPQGKVYGFFIYTSNALVMELNAIIIFNRQTGEIYRTFDFEEMRRVQEEREREVQRIWESRFTRHESGMVLDNQTGLMWAPKDNGSFSYYHDAKSYCESYRGGGYSDWRMPTEDELAGLYNEKRKNVHGHYVTDLIEITNDFVWASEASGSEAAIFSFDTGKRSCYDTSDGIFARALPVRSGK